MYATTIGRTFLQAYNRKFGAEHTARSFFEEVYVPLFFDHRKYMMTAGNSPLENPKLSWDDMIKGKKPFETSERRQERITKMIQKIENEKADASIAIGYGVVDSTAATTGQITNMALPDSKEDIYLSWIGAGLGIGVIGGLTILFNHEQILLDIYEGWYYYRKYLTDFLTLKGNQINTWNGHWISHRYDREYDADDPMNEFSPMEARSDGLINLRTISWVEVVTRIALKNPVPNLVGYIYNIGQSNTTIGFIPFKLQDILYPMQLYAKIFGEAEWTQNCRKIEQLYGTAIGLRAACQAGCIGIPAMEPKGLRAFFPTEKGMKKISYKGDAEQKITFNTYLIWILAMLNKEDLWNLSCEFAKLLLKYEAEAGKARTDRVNNVEKLLGAKKPVQFLEHLITIVEEEKEVEAYQNMWKIIYMMPADNLPYFNTLIRFQYTILNK